MSRSFVLWLLVLAGCTETIPPAPEELESFDLDNKTYGTVVFRFEDEEERLRSVHEEPTISGSAISFTYFWVSAFSPRGGGNKQIIADGGYSVSGAFRFLTERDETTPTTLEGYLEMWSVFGVLGPSSATCVSASISVTDDTFIVTAECDLEFADRRGSDHLTRRARLEIADLHISRVDSVLTKWNFSKNLPPEAESWRPDIERSLEELRQQRRLKRFGAAESIPAAPPN